MATSNADVEGQLEAIALDRVRRALVHFRAAGHVRVSTEEVAARANLAPDLTRDALKELVDGDRLKVRACECGGEAVVWTVVRP